MLSFESSRRTERSEIEKITLFKRVFKNVMEIHAIVRSAFKQKTDRKNLLLTLF